MKQKKKRSRTPRKRPDMTWLAFITFICCGSLLLGVFMNTDGGSSGEFTYYVGPVLPMTSLNGAEGVDVTRAVDFDFTPYQTGKEYTHRAVGGAGITDTYTLTNTTGETKMLELVYSFQGSFIDEPEEFPTITVDGQSIQPTLYPSVDSEQYIWHAQNFEDFSQIVSEQDFLGTALENPDKMEIPVTAYHFTDLAYESTEVASYPMLTLKFSTDENTRVWTWIADSIGTDFLMFRVDRGEAWVFTMGGALQNTEIVGNKGYNIYEGSALEDVTYQLESYGTTLGDVIHQFAFEYDYWAIEGNDYCPNPGCVTPEILAEGVIKRFPSNTDAIPYGVTQSLQGLFNETITEHRMMYQVFPVELEPGQTVTVEVTYVQEPSSDNSGPKYKREGFELATRLGSDLNFTALSSSLSNLGALELSEQNFGFDPDKGITEVDLDLNEERYYLEVRIKK